MKIKEITKEGTLYLLVKSVEAKETKTGKPYVVLSVTDGTDEVQAKMWDTTLQAAEPMIGTVISATLSVDSYGHTVREQRPIMPGEVNIADFIPTCPVKPEKLYADIMGIIGTMADMDLQRLVNHIYTENKDALIKSSAAKMMHHNTIGGLLWHSYRMTQIAMKMADIYNSANRDMIVAGCLLHDIGKLVELETDNFGTAEYTTMGKLFGHLYIGGTMIENAGAKLDTPSHKVMQLVHIVVSHHGQQEMGAVVKPQTLEAYIVSEIDMMDSKIYQFEKATASVEEGAFSDKVFGLGNIQVYHPE